MRKLCHQLDLDSHEATKGHVFDQYGEILAYQPLADSDCQYHLWVDFAFELTGGQIRDVVGCEGELPIHQDDILLRFGIRFDLVDARRFCAKGELAQAQRVEEGRSLSGEDLVNTGDYCGRKHGFVDDPEFEEEGVEPFSGFKVGLESPFF